MALTQAELQAYQNAVNQGLTAEQAGAPFGLTGDQVNALAVENGLAPLPTTAPTTPPANTTTNTGGTTPTVDTNTTIPLIPRQTNAAGQVNVPTTASPEALHRQNLAREAQAQIAAGNVSSTLPGTNLTAVPTDMTETITSQWDVQQIAADVPVQVPGQVDTVAAAATGVTGTEQQAGIAPLQTATAGVTEAGYMQPTQAATGTLSQGSVAQLEQPFQPSAGTQAQAATVGTIPPGAEVEAVTGQMNPAAIAEAAKVSGVETARIERSKAQLRKAGLTESQIAAFGNDPTSMEMALTDFTEQQRGVIAGLPVEALVSTQMEQLLAGIENGDVPVWAKPAVASVQQLMARRGIAASDIAQQDLVNAIIQSAMPIAQSNAEAIKESALQQRSFEQQAQLAEAQFKQQATLQNAQNVFNLDMRNLDAEQQAAMANSQFMQTVTLTDASNRQQTAIQNAVNMVNLDVAALDSNTKLAVENAKSFLQMDLTNLSNEQQAILVDAQYEQQKMLSNAAAQNAAAQFNASSENQINQFMANLEASIGQFNVQQINAIKTFNETEANKILAQNASDANQTARFHAELMTQVAQFNAQQELARQQWNAANAQAIEQSNVQWRRQANTADTAAQNAINQQTVQNAFGLTSQAQAALWQELRDQATFDYQAYQNKEDREAQLYASAIGNEAAAGHSYDHTTHLVNIAKSFFEA